MSTHPVPLKSSRKPAHVTTAITVIALVFGLAFGICSVSGISLSNGGNARSAHLLIVSGLIMGAICVLCLIAIGIYEYFRHRSH
jgi:uncharacterized membrane protein YbhN (UPF0104 family)